MESTTVAIPTRLLVLGMAGMDGSIRAEEVYPVAEACGQSREQIRSCLRRIVAEGLYERSGAGRDAVYLPTAQGLAHLGARLRRVKLSFDQDAAGRGWDRHWRLVAFAVPESRRSGRDALRDRLIELGGAAIQGGLYVSPHDWDDEVRDEADRLDLADNLTLASTDDLVVGGERDPRALAAMLWPLEEVAAGYERFIETYRHVPGELETLRRRHRRLPDAEFFPLTLAMGAAHDQLTHVDPFLPPELLPRPWPGRAARELVVRCRRLAVLLREQDSTHLFANYDAMVLDRIGESR